MEKDAMLEFLEKQTENISEKNFDLDLFKSAVGNVLASAFGTQSSYFRQVQSLQYLEKNSLEELYPKLVKDIEGTSAKAKQLLISLKQQVALLDEASFLSENRQEPSKAVNEIKAALQKYLNGRQVDALGSFIKTNKETEAIVEQLREFDFETSLNILAEILKQEELWDN